MKPLFVNAVLSIAVIGMTLTAGEVLVRIKNRDGREYNIEMWRYSNELKVKSAHPNLVHEHRPNRSAILQRVNIQLNGWGMRGPEPDLADTRSKRILFLGSSHTLGWGVKDEDGLVGQLRQSLKGRAQVWNAGVGNYNALQYVTLFESKLRALHPDIVVIHYYINDTEPLQKAGGNFLLRHSQLAVMMHHALYTLRHQRSADALADYYRSLYREEETGYRQMRSAFERLKALSREDGFKVVFIMMPEVHAIKPYPFSAIHEHMERLCKDWGWVYRDVSRELLKIPAQELALQPNDPHINANGYRIMAREILPVLESLV